MTPKRSTAMLTALALLVLLGLGHLIVPFLPDADKIPAIVRYGDVALGALSLIAAYGLWRLQRWGMVFTVIIAALNLVSAAPGVIAAPNLALQIVTAIYVVLSLVIIVLMIAPLSRKAPASGAIGTQK